MQNKTAQPFVSVIGGLNIDLQGSTDNPLVFNDSNPGEITMSAGGVGRNIAENIAKLNIHSKILSYVGNDALGSRTMRRFDIFQSLRLKSKKTMPILIGLGCFSTFGMFSQPLMADGHKAFELTILHTNDFHARFRPISKYDNNCSAESNAEGKCFGGTARLISAIKEARGRHENTILLDGGDQFQGTLFYNLYR